ncbi:MAG: hypothetical protein IJC39_01750 [Firmicutes bacterium]|nr:hypothetical protein [Bacillota bacterium]
MNLMEINPKNILFFRNYIIPEVYDEFFREDSQKFFGLGLSEKNFSVGALCGNFGQQGNFNIKSLFVDEAVRMYGGGYMLLSGLLSRFPGEIRSLKASYCAGDAEAEAYRALFAKAGISVPQKKSDIFCIRGGDLKGTLLYPEKTLKNNPDIVPFFSFPGEVREKLSEEEDIPSSLMWTRFEDVADPDGSLAYMKDGEIAAYVIFKPVNKKMVALCAAFTRPGNKGLFLRLIPECVCRMIEKYGEDTLCAISAQEPRVSALIEKLSENRIEQRLSEYLLLHRF